MSKVFKRMLGVAAVGCAVAAGVAYYLKKEDNEEDFLDEFEDAFEPDDVPASSERGYVSLNTAPQAEETEAPEEDNESEEASETAEAEATEEAVSETAEETADETTEEGSEA